MADEMKVTLPEGVVKPIIEAQVIAALQGQTRLIEEMVAFTLKQKVREPNTYQDVPFLELVARGAIQDAVRSAVKAWILSEQDAIQKEIMRALRGSAKTIATSMVQALASQAESTYRLNVEVKLGDR